MEAVGYHALARPAASIALRTNRHVYMFMPMAFTADADECVTSNLENSCTHGDWCGKTLAAEDGGRSA